MRIEAYTARGGQHPDTAALANTLDALGIEVPGVGIPYSEALLMGIGGGLGAGYILWEFEATNNANLVLGFRNNWQYPERFMKNLGRRLGLKFEMPETAGEKKAERNLEEALERGIPPLAWVDRVVLPHYRLPESYPSCNSYVVTVCGLDEETAWIDDRARRPFTLSREQLAVARARIPSVKNRLLLPRGPAEGDPTEAVMAGIADCVDHLSKPSTSFSLPTFRKWARMLTDDTSDKGWPRVFSHRGGLYTTLQLIFEGLIPQGPWGGSLRDLYGRFLTEASKVTGKPPLAEVGKRYSRLSNRWIALGEAALPEENETCRRTKNLLREKYRLLAEKGDDGVEEAARAGEEAEALRVEGDARFPLSEERTRSLFANLREHLESLYEAELEALEALRGVLDV